MKFLKIKHNGNNIAYSQSTGYNQRILINGWSYWHIEPTVPNFESGITTISEDEDFADMHPAKI